MNAIILMLSSVCVVQVGNTLMVEWSNGSLSEFKCYHKLTKDEMFMLHHISEGKMMRTIQHYNEMQRMLANHNLHLNKVRTLGHDYASRGYR